MVGASVARRPPTALIYLSSLSHCFNCEIIISYNEIIVCIYMFNPSRPKPPAELYRSKNSFFTTHVDPVSPPPPYAKASDGLRPSSNTVGVSHSKPKGRRVVEAPGTAPGSGPLITKPFIAIVGLTRRVRYRLHGLNFEGRHVLEF